MTAVRDNVAVLIDDPWMTTAEVAEHTKRHQSTIRRAAALGPDHGGIRSTSSGRGRGRRYRMSWADEWVDTQSARRRRA